MNTITGLVNRTPIGWLQLRRNKGRLLVAIGGIAFADLLMFMQLGVLGAALDTSALFNTMLQADIILISPEARDIQNSATMTAVLQTAKLSLSADVNFMVHMIYLTMAGALRGHLESSAPLRMTRKLREHLAKLIVAYCRAM